MKNDIKIAVAGTGYVGLSIATLLSQHHQVVAVDVVPEKVELINSRKSPIQDDYIEKYLAEKDLNLIATLDGAMAYVDADFVVIATPTNYDAVKNYFDTSHVEEVIELVKKVNPNAIMVIKSTIPVGYTENIRKKLGTENVIFSPEFLRESKALYDNLYPSQKVTRELTRQPIHLLPCCRRVQSKKTSILCLWGLQKPKLLNCSPTHILPCACLISMSLTHMQR